MGVRYLRDTQVQGYSQALETPWDPGLWSYQFFSVGICLFPLNVLLLHSSIVSLYFFLNLLILERERKGGERGEREEEERNINLLFHLFMH